MDWQNLMAGVLIAGMAIYAVWHIYLVLTGRKNDCSCSGCGGSCNRTPGEDESLSGPPLSSPRCHRSEEETHAP